LLLDCVMAIAHCGLSHLRNEGLGVAQQDMHGLAPALEGKLQKLGVITYSRGTITVRDRPRRESLSWECYGVVKKETDRLLLQRQRIDLRALVRQVIEGIELDFGRRGHRLAVNLPNCAGWLDADPGRLEQVFSNLLMNAAKYSPDRGDIKLTVERQLEYACVRISDTGIGISAELLQCVFALFVQADPSAPCSQAGLGIGLPWSAT
jgi:signal transduction histidine kinase